MKEKIERRMRKRTSTRNNLLKIKYSVPMLTRGQVITHFEINRLRNFKYKFLGHEALENWVRNRPITCRPFDHFFFN